MKLKVSIIIGVIIMIGVLGFSLFDDNKTSASIMNDVTKEEITNVVGVYIKEDDEYIKSDTIPESGYILNKGESYCRVNGEEDTNISISYDAINKTLSITPLTTKGTKCYLYFDETLNNAILADNPTIDNSRSNGITGPLTENTTGTLYTAEDDYGTSYFYAGDVDNNWVSFAGFYWRVIRINGDGSIRMIYSGEDTGTVTEANRTGEATQIGTSAFNEHANDNAYVGYMYGTPGSDTYEETHANINDSTIKTVLDNWYENNLLDYSGYLSTEQGFCNDRQIRTDLSSYYEQYYGILGYGTENTIYDTRFADGNTIAKEIIIPNLKCSQVNDYFTINGSSRGNYALNYPTGLITADEFILAGGFLRQNVSNTNYYLYTGQYYWTMSPSVYSDNAFVFATSTEIGMYGEVSFSLLGVRPVINLDKNVTISSGDGTSSNPYRI